MDYASLVSADTEGPFTLTGGSIAAGLPFGTDGITVYRNGAPSELTAANPYDVYYYNANLRTVWIYSNPGYRYVYGGIPLRNGADLRDCSRGFLPH